MVAENKNEAAEATEETLEQNLDENATEEAKTQTEETEEKPENVAEESEGKEEPEESKDTKKEKKDKKDILIEELNDKYMRTFAEFDNFRKRSEKEKAAMFEIGAKAVIEKILPIVDNFERGLSTIPEDEKNTPFADGMDKVYKQLLTTLNDLDVKPIEALGKEFDPNLHNAVMHIEDEEVGENIIIEEFQKGYTYRESVVRHSMVKVAN